MRVIVFGSREWKNPSAARLAIADRFCDLDPDTLIVHGGATGVDRFAHDEALKLGMPTPEVHRPDYERWSPKEAPKRRNTWMALQGADLAIGFWNGKSGGTWDMRRKAEAYGIPVEWIEVSQ